MFDHLADQTQPLGLGGLDPVVAVDQMVRPKRADPLRYASGDERLVHSPGQIRHPQTRPVGGDDQVGVKRHHQAAAERQTVDRTHHELRDLAECFERRPVVGLGERIPPPIGVADGVHVSAGAEHVARAGDDEEVQLWLVGHDHRRPFDPVVTVRGQRIALLWTVDRNGQRVAVYPGRQFLRREVDNGRQVGHEITATRMPMS